MTRIEVNFDTYQTHTDWWDAVTDSRLDVPPGLANMLQSDSVHSVEIQDKFVLLLWDWCAQFPGWNRDGVTCLRFIVE